MYQASKRVVFLFWILIPFISSLRESEIEWTKKLEKLKQLAKKHNIQEPIDGLHRSTGTEYFNVSFECDVKPKTVHQLRPRDIDVIGAMGDSLTAANGGEADTIVGVAREYRGMSWFAGGEGSFDTTLTIPNIIRLFNPTVQGYSIGTRFQEGKDWWYNVAEPGARARNMPEQARILIDKMKNDERTNFENDWKLVTIFIGGNDLCALESSEDATPENYAKYLKESLDILHAELPRTLVNVVEILEIYLLPQVADGEGSTPVCKIAQRLLCGYIVNAEGDEVEIIKEKNKLYQTLTQNLINSQRYDTRDDFTVVLQPFFRDTVLPVTENGNIDATFFAPDCFHFGAKGHAMGALNLWNNMLEPVGQKTTQWSITDLKCPTEESPYIFTNLNSFGEGSGEQPTTKPVTDEATTTTMVQTSASTPEVVVTTTNPPEVPECDDVCVDPEVDDWVIAVICVLSAAVLLQTLVLIMLLRKKKATGYSLKL